MSSAIQQTGVHYGEAVPWRHTQPLHKSLGARVVRGTISLAATAGVTAMIFDRPYGPQTIDRVVCMRLNLQNAFRNSNVAFHIDDLISNWRQDCSSALMTGVWTFPVETGVDRASLRITNDAAYALTFNYSLYNVELVPHTMPA